MPPAWRSAPSLQRMMEAHRPLEAAFAAHRRAVLKRRPVEALRALRDFRRMLSEHMRAEERLVLPLYRGRGGERPGGTTEIFIKEHAQMRRHLAVLFRRTRRAFRRGRGAPDAVLLRLLDRQAQFQFLMQHHGAREKNLLYPAMDALASPEERRELWKRLQEAQPLCLGHRAP